MPGPFDFVWWGGYQSNSPAPKGNKILEFMVEKAFSKDEEMAPSSPPPPDTHATMAGPGPSQGQIQAPPKSPYPSFLDFSCGEQRFDQAIVFVWRNLKRRFWKRMGTELNAAHVLDGEEVQRVHSVTKKVKQKVRKAIKPAKPPWDSPPGRQNSKRARKQQLR